MQPRSAFKEVVFMTTLIVTVGLGAWEMAYGADRALRADANFVGSHEATRVEVSLGTDRSVSTKPVKGATQVGD